MLFNRNKMLTYKNVVPQKSWSPTKFDPNAYGRICQKQHHFFGVQGQLNPEDLLDTENISKKFLITIARSYPQYI